MPSSLIFVGLVVVWLLILVPALVRHQQVVARPSAAALSGRVLARPAGPMEEDDVDDRIDDADDQGRDEGWDGSGWDDGETWERPEPRYRPGRGGYDPEAAELAARSRYAFRQRIVLGLLAAAVVAAGLALSVSPGLWWLHVLIDLALAGYLVYLRRQVRMEEAIRARRAARMAGTRRPQAAEDPELDEWARRGRAATDPVVDDLVDESDDLDDLPDTPDADRVYGTGEPAGPLRDRPGREAESALPRLAPAPPPPPPAGTTLVEGELDDLDLPVRPDRRAVG